MPSPAVQKREQSRAIDQPRLGWYHGSQERHKVVEITELGKRAPDAKFSIRPSGMKHGLGADWSVVGTTPLATSGGARPGTLQDGFTAALLSSIQASPSLRPSRQLFVRDMVGTPSAFRDGVVIFITDPKGARTPPKSRRNSASIVASPSEPTAVRHTSEPFWGPLPDPALVLEAITRNRSRLEQLETSIVALSLSRTQVAQLLGTSPREVDLRTSQGHLAVFEHKGENWFPSWQFDTAKPQTTVDGLDQLLEAYPEDVVALTSWLSRPCDDLDGEFPLALLRLGQWQEVVDAIPHSPGE